MKYYWNTFCLVRNVFISTQRSNIYFILPRRIRQKYPFSSRKNILYYFKTASFILHSRYNEEPTLVLLKRCFLSSVSQNAPIFSRQTPEGVDFPPSSHLSNKKMSWFPTYCLEKLTANIDTSVLNFQGYLGYKKNNTTDTIIFYQYTELPKVAFFFWLTVDFSVELTKKPCFPYLLNFTPTTVSYYDANCGSDYFYSIADRNIFYCQCWYYNWDWTIIFKTLLEFVRF